MSERIVMWLPREKMTRWKIAQLTPNVLGKPYTHQFVDYLATRCIGDITSPEEFWLNVECAFIDLKKGVDHDGPIRHEAADRVPTVEMLVRRDLAAVIDALFSPEDAAAIKKCKEEITAEAKVIAAADTAAKREEQRQQVNAHLDTINKPKSSQLTTADSKPKRPKAKKAKKMKKTARKKK